MKQFTLKNIDNYNISSSINLNKYKTIYFIPEQMYDTFQKYLNTHPDDNHSKFIIDHYKILMSIFSQSNSYIRSDNDYKRHLAIHLRAEELIRIQYIIGKQIVKYVPVVSVKSLVILYEGIVPAKAIKYSVKSPILDANPYLKSSLINAELDINKAISVLLQTAVDKKENVLKGLATIINFNSAKYMKQGKKVERIYSSFTELPGIIRLLVTINGKQLIGYDMKAAQPTLLVLLLNKYNLPVDSSYKEECYLVYDKIMNLAKASSIKSEKIYNKANRQSEELQFDNRDEVKVLLFRSIYFYFKSIKRSKTAKLFNELYPVTYSSMKKLAGILKQQKISIAQAAQNLEVEVLLYNLPKTEVLTCHDAIYFIDEQIGDQYIESIKVNYSGITTIRFSKEVNNIEIQIKETSPELVDVDLIKKPHKQHKTHIHKQHKEHKPSTKSVELLNQFKQLIEEGKSRAEIESELNLKGNYYYKLKAKL